MWGLGAYALTDGHPTASILIPASILAMTMHLAFDDLNNGNERIYHGFGESKLIKRITSLLRVPIWLGLIWLFIHYPWVMVTALPAWLICDWEWLVKWNIGVGVHNKNEKRPWLYMWHDWMKTQWVLIPVFVALYVFLLMIGIDYVGI